MRIMSGKFRGRRLKGPRSMDLRPTGDRLKETLFNIVAPEIAGSRVLDVFAGTGAIGLEALSRGAQQVVFIESGQEALRLIRQNLALCGITEGFRILQGDVFAALRTLAREAFAADLTFLDPPYQWRPYGDLLEILFGTGIARPGSKVVIEHHRKSVMPESEKGFQRVRTVRQGDKCLSFYEPIE